MMAGDRLNAESRLSAQHNQPIVPLQEMLQSPNQNENVKLSDLLDQAGKNHEKPTAKHSRATAKSTVGSLGYPHRFKGLGGTPQNQRS